ncbi:MAG: hypothetical protein HYX68_16325 [Planctomycetes bacterium]|jgi:hypothetical protein|nr:hypothetical protein [Planctomycetota bacterium]
MKAMPHLVEMHNKHADKGLVVITVALDPPDQKDLVAQAQAFLQKIKSPVRNLLLAEPEEYWSKKLDFVFPPCYYVFDRRGKWVRFRATDFDDGIPYAQMDKLILQMLADK